jgi:hypothetical protein
MTPSPLQPPRAVGHPRLLGALVLAALIGVAAASARAADDAEDSGPFAVRRLLLPPDRLAAELDRARPGPLEQLPRAEFEALLARARKNAAARGTPRLVRASYQAHLEDAALVGTGEWQVFHPGPGPGLLPLHPPKAPPGQQFSLALRKARFADRDALIADHDGLAPSLLLDGPGEHAVALEWSARAEARPEGLLFQLHVPPCPAALLELELPADRSVTLLVTTPEGAGRAPVLSGPHPAGADDRRLWKLGFSGRSHVTLLVRQAEGAGPPLLLVRRQTSQQDLSPEGLDARFEFDLEAPRQGVRELACQCDPSLRPYEVAAPNLEKWELKEPILPGLPALLLVWLREPLHEGTLKVRCLAPLGEPARPSFWSSPAMKVVGAAPRGEALTLRFHPDLKVEDWQAGSFRVVGAAAEADRTQVLTLVGGGLEPDGARRPFARLLAPAAEYRCQQLAWWQPNARPAALTLQLTYEVSQGSLFQLPVQLPDGWEPERVDLAPAGLLASSRLQVENGRPVLRVELQRPLRPADASRPPPRRRGATLTVRLRPAPRAGRGLPPEAVPPGLLPEALAPLLAAAWVEPFPDAVPLGAPREGGLAVDVDDQLHEAQLATAATPGEPPDEGPWDRQAPPEFFFPYRGQPAQGLLALKPRAPRLGARCSTEVVLAPTLAFLTTRISLEAEAGCPQTVDVELSAPGGPWTWQTEQGANSVVRQEPLPADAAAVLALAARSPLDAALAAAARGGRRWRLTLARPLRAGEPLTLKGYASLPLPAGRWYAPLPAVLGADRLEGEARLVLAGADVGPPETAGLHDADAQARPEGPAAWHNYRYGPGPRSLSLPVRSTRGGPGAAAVVDHARLTTCVWTDGNLYHHYSFTVAGWTQRWLTLRLPPGARPLAVRVDGDWLGHLTPGKEDELLLPVPRREGASADEPHRFEVLYATGGPSWALWARVEAPAPAPPVPPVLFRRTWRLPPGVTPLFDAGLRRLPGPGEAGAAGPPPRPDDLFRLWEWPALPSAAAGPADRRQALDEAARALASARAGQSPPLREVLEQLAFAHLGPRHPLVIDAGALREAGVRPEAPLAVPAAEGEDAPPPWAALGLEAVAGREAVLLTTQGQLKRWPAGRPLSDAVEEALGQAVREGRDPSGRFVAALNWLRPARETSRDDVPPLPLPSPLAPGLALDGWTEWEPIAGADEAGLTVGRRELGWAGGAALTALLALAGWQIRRWPGRWRLRALALGLTLAGLGLLWLPGLLQPLAWLPFLAGCLTGLLWLVFAARPRPAPGKTPGAAAAGATAAALLLALGGVGSGADPAPPAPVTVYLVSGPDGQENVLAPRDFLERLKAPAAAGAPVLVEAHYEGKATDAAAEIKAVFQAWCPDDGPALLALPLGGVLLDGGVVWLDGARVNPTALPAPQEGFAVKVKDRGKHTVELHFKTAVSGPPDERSFQFTAPRVPLSTLSVRLPSGAEYVQVPVKQGFKGVTADADGVTLQADLGRVVAPVQVRWQSPPRKAGLPMEGRPEPYQYQEAYVWELRPEGGSLTALLHFTVREGATTTFLVDVPPTLEVRSARAADGPADRLRDWKLDGTMTWAGPTRRLRLEFSAPVKGEASVLLELLPAGPLGAGAPLPLPNPHGQPRTLDGHLAFRTQGVEAQRVNNWPGVVGLRARQFAPFWPADSRPELADPDQWIPFRPVVPFWPADTPPEGPQDYACTFRRQGGRPPSLPVRVQPRRTAVRQEVSWRVGALTAEMTLRARLTARGADLAVVEWDLPSPQPLTVVSVSSTEGPRVRRWGQSGNRLLVWLESAASTVQLEMTAWAGVDHGRLDLPSPRVPSAQPGPTLLWLSAEPGLELKLTGPRNLLPARGALPAPDGIWFIRDPRDPAYGGVCQVQPSPVRAEARVLTFVEARDHRLTFTAVADVTVRQGELGELTARLRGWEGAEVQLTIDREASRRERRHGPRDRSWTATLRPGLRGRCRLTLSGSMPLEDAPPGMAAPTLTLPGVQRVESWVALAGPALKGEATGLEVADPARALASWPERAAQLSRSGGAAWKVVAPEGRLRLQSTERAAAPAVEVYLQERSAAAADGRRWLHEARFWLRHEAGGGLTVVLPAPGTVIAASVDGTELLPLQPGPKRLWLPLPGRAGVRRVRLCWFHGKDEEALARPNLAPVRLEGVADGPLLGVLAVPSGWRPDGATAARLHAGAAAAAAQDLARADAQLRLSRALAGQKSDPALAAAQKRFYLHCRRAERALEMAGDRGREAGPDSVGLAEWLRRLKEDNRRLAESKGFEQLRSETQRQAQMGAAFPPLATAGAADPGGHPWGPGEGRAGVGVLLPPRGTPYYWRAAAGAPPPTARLAPGEEGDPSPWPWVTALAVVWLLSLLPFAGSWVRLFKLELLAGLGLFGCWLAGPTPVAVGLLLIWAIGRLVGLVRALRRLTWRPPAAAARVGSST